MTNHYEALGIEKEATPSQVKKAYHKLALENHPDRAGPQGTERMKVINLAYETLKDPQRRQLYDRFGDRADMLGQGPALTVIQRIGLKAFLIFVLVSVFLLMSGLVILLSCVAAKVDGSSMSWTAAFAGAWIMDIVFAIWAFALAAAAAIFVAASGSMDVPLAMKVFTPVALIVASAMLVLNIVFSILVVRALNKTSSLSAMQTFIPNIISQVVFTLLALLGLCAPRNETEASAPMSVSIVNRGSQLLMSILMLAFSIVLPQKIDGDVTSSWPVVFIPVFLWFVVIYIRTTITAFLTNGVQGCCTAACAQLLAIGGLATSAGLVSAKLEGTLDAKLGLCLIPVYIMFGMVWIMTCCGCCFTTCALGAMDEDDLAGYQAADGMDGNDGMAQQQDSL